MTRARSSRTKTAVETREHVSASRLRLVSVERTHDPGARFRVQVRIEWLGQVFNGVSAGVGQEDMIVRSAAAATLEAMHLATEKVSYRLVGSKHIRAFDSEVVMVCLCERDRPERKYIGAVAAHDTLEDGAARAVLDATNRLLLLSLADSQAT